MDFGCYPFFVYSEIVEIKLKLYRLSTRMVSAHWVFGLSLLACISAVTVSKPISAGYFCSAYGPEAPKPWCGGTSDPKTELS